MGGCTKIKGHAAAEGLLFPWHPIQVRVGSFKWVTACTCPDERGLSRTPRVVLERAIFSQVESPWPENASATGLILTEHPKDADLSRHRFEA